MATEKKRAKKKNTQVPKNTTNKQCIQLVWSETLGQGRWHNFWSRAKCATLQEQLETRASHGRAHMRVVVE
eukprot:5317707-Amphidinium_carterae.1